jgi:uncharacterized protein (UPF0303 family)
MTTMEELISVLEEQERKLVFPSFDQLDAWRVGQLITDAAIVESHKVLIDIRRPNLVLFRAALPGSAPDQESWAQRKAAVVLRMESSSALVAAQMQVRRIDPIAIGWLDANYALAGGSFPIRVKGAGVVAAVTASGLSSDGDHELVVRGIEEFLGK